MRPAEFPDKQTYPDGSTVYKCVCVREHGHIVRDCPVCHGTGFTAFDPEATPS